MGLSSYCSSELPSTIWLVLELSFHGCIKPMNTPPARDLFGNNSCEALTWTGPFGNNSCEALTWTGPHSPEQDKVTLFHLDGLGQVHHRLRRDDGIRFLVIVHGHHELDPAKLVGAIWEVPL